MKKLKLFVLGCLVLGAFVVSAGSVSDSIVISIGQAPPTGFSTTTPACGGNVNLVWTAASGATGYTILVDSVVYTTIPIGTATSQTVSGLVPGSGHSFNMYATGPAGNSATVSIPATIYASAGCPPTITSPTATSVAATTATLGANVTSFGTPSTALTARGVCYLPNSAPTAAQNGTCVSVTPFTSLGAFSTSVTGLTANTLYRYVGYAQNSVGRVYTSEGTFTTATNAVPTVVTLPATNISSYYNTNTTDGTIGPMARATLNLNVTSLGVPANPSSANPGFCFSVSPETNPIHPETATTECIYFATSGGTATTGVYSFDLIGDSRGASKIKLLPGNTYYFRGNAMNQTGYGQGSVLSFTTPPLPSGSISASVPSCAIPAGASSCNVNVTWSTSNPIGTSSVTSNYPSANTILATANSGTNQPIAVPYLSSPRMLYLYNSSILLDSVEVYSSCAPTTSWNGTTCATNTYTVTANALSGGSITPSTRTVSHGATTTFTVTPYTGYTTTSVTGCGGTRSGTTYTTGAITANCTVTASFTVNTYTVTGTAGANGTISPATRSVNHNSTTTFTVTPNAGYFASVSGCGGTLSGTTYTTGPITGACTVSATFTAVPVPNPVLTIINTWGITNGAQNGMTYSGASYTVSWPSVSNATSCTLNGASVTTTGSTSTGTATGWTGSTRTFTLSCTGPGGTGSSSSVINYPPAPSNFVTSCPAPGTTANLSWTLPSGYTTSFLRVVDNVTGLDALRIPEVTPDTGPSASFTSISGRSYSATVFTRSSNNAYSTSLSSNFTCGAAFPELTASAPTPSTASVGSAVTFSSTITNSSSSATGAGFSNFFQVASAANGGGTITDKTSTAMAALAGSATGVTTTSHTFASAGTYSIRACADKTNSASLGVITEGNELNNCSAWTNVTASALLPSLTTSAVSAITQTTATSGGNITSTGGSTIDPSGCVWSTSSNPTYNSSQGPISGSIGQTTNGPSGVGSYSCSLTGLTAGTTYYVRAYARNTAGTSYGSNVSFTTTGPTAGTLTATGCTIAENQSNCNTTLTWTTTNPVTTSRVRSPNETGTTIATANSGTITASVPYNTRTFVLENNGVAIRTISPVASCAANTHWNGSICILDDPTNVFASTPATIFKGRSAVLSWNSPLSDTCVGVGFSTGAGSPVVGSVTVSPLETTDYTLRCTNTSGTTDTTVTTKVIILDIGEN